MATPARQIAHDGRQLQPLGDVPHDERHQDGSQEVHQVREESVVARSERHVRLGVTPLYHDTSVILA